MHYTTLDQTNIHPLWCGYIPVYQLPFSTNKAYWVAHGYWSKFSHHKTYALDFKMRRGQPVHAARSGVVLAAASDLAEKKEVKKFYRKGRLH